MFSDEQLDDVIRTIRGIIDGMMTAGNSGMVGRAREMTAITQYLAQAAETFGDNPLVGQLLDYGDSLAQKSDFDDPADLFTAMGNLGDSLPADDAGNGLRQFIYGMTEAVASASGKGLFGSGAKISDDESNFLDLLRSKLGL
jgi:hypothetical protein